MNKLICILGTLLVTLSACTFDKGEIAVVKPTNTTMVTILITDNVFTPATVAATVGDTIKWINNGTTHTVDSLAFPVGAAAFPASPNIVNATDSFTYIVNVQGTYSYGCAIHPPAMIGTINVTQ